MSISALYATLYVALGLSMLLVSGSIARAFIGKRLDKLPGLLKYCKILAISYTIIALPLGLLMKLVDRPIDGAPAENLFVSFSFLFIVVFGPLIGAILGKRLYEHGYVTSAALVAVIFYLPILAFAAFMIALFFLSPIQR